METSIKYKVWHILLVMLMVFVYAQTPDHTDLNYSGDTNPAHTLDIYLPDGPGPFPVVVYIHGGGWTSGSKSAGKNWAYLNDDGLALVSITYRFSGEAFWPAQSHDVKAAIRWIRANAATYSLNADRIGVTGTSAGGHLANILGTSGDVGEFTVGSETADLEGTVGSNLQYSSRVQAAVPFYGPTDFLRMNDFPGTMDHDAPNSPESKLVGAAIQTVPDKVALANPITFITGDDPPFLLVHGTADKLVHYNQAELLHAALKKVYDTTGTDLVLKLMEGGGHGGELTVNAETKQATADFFIKHIKNITAIVSLPGKTARSNQIFSMQFVNNSILLHIKKSASVQLRLYNLQGRCMARLFNGHLTPGKKHIPFNKSTLSSGVVIVKMLSDGITSCKEVALIK